MKKGNGKRGNKQSAFWKGVLIVLAVVVVILAVLYFFSPGVLLGPDPDEYTATLYIEDSSGSIVHEEDLGFVPDLSSEFEISWEVALPNGEYDWYVVVYDPAGAEVGRSETRSFTVSKPTGSVPPVIVDTGVSPTSPSASDTAIFTGSFESGAEDLFLESATLTLHKDGTLAHSSTKTYSGVTSDDFTEAVSFEEIGGFGTYYWSFKVCNSASICVESEPEAFIYYDGTTGGPTVFLESPIDGGGAWAGDIEFSYVIVNGQPGSSLTCTPHLIVGITSEGETIIGTPKTSIFNGEGVIRESVIMSSINSGDYQWSINCESVTSGSNRLRVIGVDSGISGGLRTTDITKYILTSVPSFTLHRGGAGEIKFKNPVDLSGVTDFTGKADISSNKAEIDSSMLPTLNAPATITLEGLSFTTPQIMKDGEVCDSSVCTQTIYSGGTLAFEVTGFSVYSARETPGDSTETGDKGGTTRRDRDGGTTPPPTTTPEPDPTVEPEVETEVEETPETVSKAALFVTILIILLSTGVLVMVVLLVKRMNENRKKKEALQEAAKKAKSYQSNVIGTYGNSGGI